VRRPAAFTQVWWREWGLSAMLVFLVLSLFVALPLEAMGVISSTVVGVAMTFLFVAGVVAMAGRGPVTGVVASAAIASLVVRWLSLTSPSRGLDILDLVLGMVALALLTAVLLRHVFREGPITADRIRGAIAVYLLIGVLWCLAYQLLDHVAPGSFHFPETGLLVHGRLSHRLAYFSFVTLTTVGYGDITPLHPIARSLAAAEALVGQLYPAILIGRLVSLQISNRQGGASK
jgi:Ion channel